MSEGEFVALCRASEVPEGRGLVFRIDRKLRIAVRRVGDRYVAHQDECPHMGASLADGRVEGGRVVCWWHGWTFDLASGQGDARPWACIRIYECKVERGEVLVRLPEPEPEPEPEPGPEAEWIAGDPNRFFKDRREPGDEEPEA